jgi:hypothetical protein
VPFFSQRLRLKVPFSEVAPCPFEILARTLWLMGILNLVYCYLFLFVYLAVLQAIYIDMVFCRVNVSPLFLFPLNPGISWKWTENSLFWLEYLSVLCLKVSIYQFCRKQLTKLANLLMHSQCALSEPISSSRKTRKLTVCRFI